MQSLVNSRLFLLRSPGGLSSKTQDEPYHCCLPVSPEWASGNSQSLPLLILDPTVIAPATKVGIQPIAHPLDYLGVRPQPRGCLSRLRHGLGTSTLSLSLQRTHFKTLLMTPKVFLMSHEVRIEVRKLFSQDSQLVNILGFVDYLSLS